MSTGDVATRASENDKDKDSLLRKLVPIALHASSSEWIELPSTTSKADLKETLVQLRGHFSDLLSENRDQLHLSQSYSRWHGQYLTSLRVLMQLQQIYSSRLKKDIPVTMKRTLCYSSEENKQILLSLGMVCTEPRPFRTRRTKRTLNQSTPVPQPQKANTKIAVCFDHKCCFCGRKDTPEWRRGPDGRRTLCNACGLIYKKRKKMLYEMQHPELCASGLNEKPGSGHTNPQHKQPTALPGSPPQRQPDGRGLQAAAGGVDRLDAAAGSFDFLGTLAEQPRGASAGRTVAGGGPGPTLTPSSFSKPLSEAVLLGTLQEGALLARLQEDTLLARLPARPGPEDPYVKANNFLHG
eukprot:CAMPEP_0177678310 /NCGR_PEP_ID=MMETSP0447-20121125/28942_1 /TAXON_ID=0 /ORGANISM="Stygamoeba regulata, Strain BSH-02190019" /LENGTH=352 /DNA_ID=CAMNT_0019187307 /DNA_START=280 /DNA_END=1336 /DNA_ORIENTATION=+